MSFTDRGPVRRSSTIRNRLGSPSAASMSGFMLLYSHERIFVSRNINGGRAAIAIVGGGTTYAGADRLRSVMMPARPVDVAVRELFGRGIANVCDFHVEVQILPGKGVVAIERHHVARDASDGDRARAVACLRTQLHTDFDVRNALQRAAR